MSVSRHHKRIHRKDEVTVVSSDKRHEAWLKFSRDVIDLVAGRSKEDLIAFRNLAHHEHRALVPIIDELLRMAEASDTDVRPKRAVARTRKGSRQMHLFDLLREKTFFPQNLDLARFAERVLPHLRTYRYDKMSRSDIAARIIEHIESRDPETRDALEASMRDALSAMSGKQPKEVERRSFLSKWENIIKGDTV
jgi:hypothetical protein